jgi:hypothetical protein
VAARASAEGTHQKIRKKQKHATKFEQAADGGEAYRAAK